MTDVSSDHAAVRANASKPVISFRRWICLSGLVCLALFGIQAESVAAEDRLFEKEPFDRITLDKENDHAVLKVFPLDFPNRQVPAHRRPSQKLKVRLLDEPETEYELQWGNIDKIELYEQILLDETTALIKAGQFEEVFEWITFLRANYPEVPGLEETIETYLYEEAKAFHRAGNYPAALARLRELHARNPNRDGLEKALGMTTEVLVKESLDNDNHAAARALLSNLAAWYPKHDVVTRWEGELKDQAAKLAGDARAAVAEGRFHDADEIVRRLMRIWPDLPGARELLATVQREYPRIVVGVASPAVLEARDRMTDWAYRRDLRLLNRTLTEYRGPGTDGGNYICPMGTLQREELEGRLKIQLRPDIRWSRGNAVLTGSDVARRLWAMAQVGTEAYQPEWEQILDTVRLEGVFKIDITLRRHHVLPQGLLQTILPDDAAPVQADQPPPTLGPYHVFSQESHETVFVVNDQYFDASDSQPKEIVERYLPESKQAIAALRRGEIQVLDRVRPWEVEELRSAEAWVVEPYAVPLVHCLVPNLRKPLTAHPGFRRALVFGIDREEILKHLLGGKERDGCRVVSGPFPPGSTRDDPLGYAYDDGLTPRPYDPTLAIALAEVALREVAARGKKDEEKTEAPPKEAMPRPKLVLAHAPDAVAQTACEAIRRQLHEVGIELELRAFGPGEPVGLSDDVDLVYVELAAWEPVVDAWPLLGENGMAGAVSPYLSLALRQLRQATDWRRVSARLREIHRIVYDEVAVVPLWQLTDHFLYHRSLRGFGSRPVTLYENVERWRTAAGQSTEQP